MSVGLFVILIAAAVAVIAGGAIGGGTIAIQKKKRKKAAAKSAAEAKANVAKTASAQPAQTTKKCSLCGAIIPAEANVCTRCGRPVDAKGNVVRAYAQPAAPIVVTAPLASNAEKPIETKKCSFCHYEMPKVDRFCPNCGKEVDIFGNVIANANAQGTAPVPAQILAPGQRPTQTTPVQAQAESAKEEVVNKPVSKHVGWDDDDVERASGDKSMFSSEIKHVGWDDETIIVSKTAEEVKAEEAPAPVVEEKVEEVKAEESAPAVEETPAPVEEVKAEEPAPVVEEQNAEEPAPAVEEKVEEIKEENTTVVAPVVVATEQPVNGTIIKTEPKKTFKESLEASSKGTRAMYTDIMEYALSKEDTRESEAQYAMSVLCGRLKLMQVMFQRNKLVCKFMAGSSELKKYSQNEKYVKIKEKPVIVEIDSRASVEAAKELIDISHKNIQTARNKDEKPKKEAKAETVATEKKVEKKAEKKSAKKVEKKVDEKPVEAPVAETKAEEVKTEPVVTEPVSAVEEQKVVESAPVAEEKVAEPAPAEVKAEETPAEAPVVEAKTEETAATKDEVKEETKEEGNTEVAKKEPAKKAPAKTATKKEPAKTTAKKEAAKPATKKEPAKKATATVAKAPAKKTTTAKKPTGKWIIEHKGEGEYMAKLAASNGEVMLSSEIYTTEEGAKAGIETIIKNTVNGNFIAYQNKNGSYYYKLKTANNKLLCVGEIYKTKEQCLKSVESVKRIAADAVVSADIVEDAKYVDYVPEKDAKYEVKGNARGKWKVEETEDGFSAKLYASNGQLMLATEAVAAKMTAKKNIDLVKKYSADGNFIIDRDKFGRFYYKLRNAQKSVVCIGEAYESKESCISALESVRRFAATAEVVEDATVETAENKD